MREQCTAETHSGALRQPANPIEFLSTGEVWAYLLQKPNPWGGDNRPLYKLYASASNGECRIQKEFSYALC